MITSVLLKLSKKPTYHIKYGTLESELEKMGVKELSLTAIATAVIHIRQSKLPDPKDIGNAGSFFKNPTIGTHEFEKLKEIFVSIAEPVLGILSPLMDILNLVLPGISAAFQVILTPISWLAAGIREIVGLFQGGELTLKGMAKLAVGLVGTFALYRAIMLGITAQKMIQGSLDAREVFLGKTKLAQLVAQAVAWTIMNPFKALKIGRAHV